MYVLLKFREHDQTSGRGSCSLRDAEQALREALMQSRVKTS